MPPTTVTRPPTSDELAVITAPPARLFGWLTGIAPAVAFLALSVLVQLFMASYLDGPPPWVVSAALGGGVGGASAWYALVQYRARQALARRVAAQAAERGAGHVIATTYDVRDAIRVEQSEDEGLSFYLLLDDGRTLFLSGQYLDDAAEQGFPWVRFETVRAPIRGWIIAVHPLGASLPGGRARAPFTEKELTALPKDGALLSIDFTASATPGTPRR